MKSKIKSAILLMKLEDGSVVQRPMKTVEINFVMPMLQEFDGGTLKVFPAEGITLEKKS